MDWPGLAKPPEKRKVGGSTPPLTTQSDQAQRLRGNRAHGTLMTAQSHS
jgi:hypothetical protein